MKRPLKGRANITLVVVDHESRIKIEIADCDREAAMRVLRAGREEMQRDQNRGSARKVRP